MGAETISVEEAERREAAAAEAARAPLLAQLAEVQAAQAEDAVATAVAEARAELEARITELGNTLEVTRAETAAARQETADARAEHDADRSYLAAVAVRDERVAAVKALELLDDKDVDERADAYAAMTSEQWDDQLAMLTAVRAKNPKTPAPTVDPLTGRTVMTATVEGEDADGPTLAKGPRALRVLREQGVDVRSAIA